MNPAGLLAELEPMDHGARMRRMVELGRAAAGDREVDATLDDLAGSASMSGSWPSRRASAAGTAGTRPARWPTPRG